MNAVEIEEAISLLAEQPFVPGEFPYSFLEAFGNKETTIKRLKTGNNNKSDVEGAVLQHNNIHIGVSQKGRVVETLNKLKSSPATAKAKAKFILATDGLEFQAEDLGSGETIVCDYPAFHNYFGLFLPLAGISTVKQIRENAFDIKATSRLNKLYIELLSHNPDWAAANRRHDMNHFLARLVFCFFAEDTGIFQGDGLFTNCVHKMSAGDGSNTHEIISEIFLAMDIKGEERANKKVKKWAIDFPYVNGQLFAGSNDTPRFTKIARSYLLHVGNLDWKQINPDIFGSMIQAVADDDERGALGLHYTSVPNILKVLNPLFLDDLRAQLEEAGENSRKLLNLRKRISRIRVFDPACGSGNFLVIAYKQMREIEYAINKLRGERDLSTEIPLTNFRGIELRDFAAEVARLALIIAEYQCDVLYRGQKLALAEFLPLDSENWITRGNALQIDWFSICPSTGISVKSYSYNLFTAPQGQIDFENEGGETYICGNPPYLGSKRQTDDQKADLRELFEGRAKSWKSLDYVSGWFLKAADYGTKTNTTAAFVATNSVCQGQHVPILWPLIFQIGHNISFAHTSFKWANLASRNAGVTVVIVGITSHSGPKRRLFSLGDQGETIVKEVSNINGYLVAAENIEVKPMTSPYDTRATMQFGNHTYYGLDLLLTRTEAAEISKMWPESDQFLRDFLGSKEVISGVPRKCLWINEVGANRAMKIPPIANRVQKVANARGKIKGDKSAQKLAQTPYKFREEFVAQHHVIVVPAISSENRPFLPVDTFSERHIVGHKCYALYDAPLWNMALIASRLHWVWIGAVCVRLEMRFSYSNTLGWNTFPVPQLTEKNKQDLTKCAEEILIAREHCFPDTIADLYDPEGIPEDLRRAHDRNDEVLERIFIGRRFKNDTERLERLFDLYTQMTTKQKNV